MLDFSSSESVNSGQSINATPEPVLYAYEKKNIHLDRYRRGNLKIQCSKPLLLQLFGSVALLNVSETPRCRDEIIKKGAIHYIFEASEKVKEHSDLWFILYYVCLFLYFLLNMR